VNWQDEFGKFFDEVKTRIAEIRTHGHESGLSELRALSKSPLGALNDKDEAEDRIPEHRLNLFGTEVQFIDGMYFLNTGLLASGSQIGAQSISGAGHSVHIEMI
jgi:hypothetical protein